jgi:hypothetical protein
MRLLRRPTPPTPPTISVGELADGGLDGHPAATAVRFPTTDIVTCRRHVSDPIFRTVVAQLQDPTEPMVLLFDAEELDELCLRCRMGAQ